MTAGGSEVRYNAAAVRRRVARCDRQRDQRRRSGGWYRGGRYGSGVLALWKRGTTGAYTLSLPSLLPGSVSGEVLAVNDVPQAVGRDYLADSSERPILWTALDLSIPGDVWGNGVNINQSGLVLFTSREPFARFPGGGEPAFAPWDARNYRP